MPPARDGVLESAEGPLPICNESPGLREYVLRAYVDTAE